MRAEGCALPLYRYIDDKPYYCANAVTLNSSGDLGCYAGSPFTLNSGELVWDKAALANYTLSDNNSESTSNGTLNNKNENAKDNNDVAIGAGVGVPLGVLLLTALGWALYERKKRHSLQALVAGIHSQAAVAQLNTQGNTPVYTPLRELPDTQKPPQELATSESRV
ncbi:hypothetical protein N7467_010929 [Penicillium canescens]|nr:hypothetical protein N7467_010929 [Penicillium canescens]